MNNMPYCATILFHPILPWWLLGGGLAIFAGTAWFSYRRCGMTLHKQLLLWTMRMVGVAIVAWLILQPERRNISTEAEMPVLAVVLDVSASMTEDPARSGRTRAERAAEFLNSSMFKRSSERYRLKYFEMADDATELSLPEPDKIEFTGAKSQIGTGLNSVGQRLRAENVAGIILLSDGLDQSTAELTPRTRSVPILTLELEPPMTTGQEPLPDAYIDDVSYPAVAVVNWDATVDVLVRRTGLEPATFPIHLFQEGNRIKTSQASFAAGETFKRFSFTIHPEREGRIFYYLEIVPGLDGNPANNLREFIVEVATAENRVLYLEGVPRWEFKFLKHALMSEEAFRLSAFVRGASGTFVSFGEDQGMGMVELPKLDQQELARVKVLILGDLEATALNVAEQQQILTFVERGGGLLFLGGRKSWGNAGWASSGALAKLLPVTVDAEGHMEDGRFAVELTAAGRAHPALRELLYTDGWPPLLSVWRTAKADLFSTVLTATADGAPVIVTRRFGQGRVAAVLTDSLWRWQLGGDAAVADQAGGKSLYAAFITQLTNWLAPSGRELQTGELLQIVTRTSEFELRERIDIGALYEGNLNTNEELTCSLTTPSGRRLSMAMRPAELGANVGLTSSLPGYLCQFTAHEAGKYTITVLAPGGTATDNEQILVKRAAREFGGGLLNREYLRQIAESTGGKWIPWPERKELFKTLKHEPRIIEIVEEYPVWNHPFWFIALVALLLGEWWLRRRSDLV